MSLYEKIEKLINFNKMTLNELSKRTGIPYTTFCSMKRRNSNRINIMNLEKIAEVLGVTVNYFMSNVTTGDSICLTPEEEELVLKMRFLDDHGKKIIKNILDCEVERLEQTVEVKVEVVTQDIQESKIVEVDINKLEEIVDKLDK